MKNTRLRVAFFATARKNRHSFNYRSLKLGEYPADVRPILSSLHGPAIYHWRYLSKKPTFAWLMAWWHVINHEAGIIDTFIFDLPRPSTIRSPERPYINYGCEGNYLPLLPLSGIKQGVDLTGIMQRRAIVANDLDIQLTMIDDQIRHNYTPLVMQLKLMWVGRREVDPVVRSLDLRQIYNAEIAPNTPFFSGVDLESAGLSLRILREPSNYQFGIARIAATETASLRLEQAADNHTPLAGLYVRRDQPGAEEVELRLNPENSPGHTNIRYHNLIHRHYSDSPITGAIRLTRGDWGDRLSLNGIKKPVSEPRGYSVKMFAARYMNSVIEYYSVWPTSRTTRHELNFSDAGGKATQHVASLVHSPFCSFTVIGPTSSVLDGGELARALSVLRGDDTRPIDDRMPPRIYGTPSTEEAQPWV